MQAAVYVGKGRFNIQEIPDPRPGEGEVLLRVKSTSICGSDLSRSLDDNRAEIFHAIQGHEYAGEVLETRVGFSAGDRVCVYPAISCGICDACMRGLDHLCINLVFLGIQQNGGFAEKAVVPAQNLYRLPQGLDMKFASLVEPLAVSLHAVRKAQPAEDETVVIFGFGMIGFFCACLLRSSGVQSIFVVEVNPNRLDIARSYGFEGINPTREDIVLALGRMNEGRLADVVLDCAGQPDVPNLLASTCRVMGRIILVGTYGTIPRFDLLKIIRREAQIFGSRIYTRADFMEAIHSLGTWPDKEKMPFIFLPLSEINNGFHILRTEPDTLKIILTS